MRLRFGKLLGIAAVLVAILAMSMPTAALAATYPTLNGRTYYGTGSYDVYDMNGARQAIYRGLGLVFSSQASEVVGGTVRLYTVSTIRGTYLTGGTATIVPISLAEGNNTVLVYASGDLSLVLPAGVSAVATSGSAAVTGSPLTLAAGGTRTIPTTTGGVFTLAVSRTYTTLGTFSGVVGENTVTKPRFQLVGTQAYATATQGTATLTGSPVKCLPASTTLDVTGAGTIAMAVPYGMAGTATSGTATIAGSPVTLPAGATTNIDTGATTGSVTIAMRTIAAYNISGRISMAGDGSVTYLKGRFDGFVITDNVNWTVYQTNEAISLKYVP